MGHRLCCAVWAPAASLHIGCADVNLRQTKFQRKLKLRLRALADRFDLELRHHLKVSLR